MLDCHLALKSCVNLSSNIYNDKPEHLYKYKRNLLAFYTYTDIEAASIYLDSLLKENEAPYYRYFLYTAGPIKLMNNNLKDAKLYLNKALDLKLSPIYEGNILNNIGVLKMSIINEVINFNKNTNDSDNLNKELEQKFYNNVISKDDYLKFNTDNEYEEAIIYLKLAIQKYENSQIEDDKKEDSQINNNDDNNILLNNNIKNDIFNTFLISKKFSPSNLNSNSTINEESIILEYFKNSTFSSKTITNILEYLFESNNNENLKSTGFWIKAGLQNKNNPNICRQLIISGLVYSQLRQTMIAEGMYRQCIDILNKSDINAMNSDNLYMENKINLSLCLNMYGRLLLRTEKRQEEGQSLIKKSENIKFNNWLKLSTKLHYLGFDF